MIVSDPTGIMSKKSYSQQFVDYILSRCSDPGSRAAMKRADNPITEYQSWDILAGFSVDLENEDRRLAHALISSALARSDRQKNGMAGIGRSIASCYSDGNQDDQAKAKLRRLLACSSIPELCRVLRPIFSLVNSRSNIGLDYAKLLDQILRFQSPTQRERVKAAWAQDFYGKILGSMGGEEGGE